MYRLLPLLIALAMFGSPATPQSREDVLKGIEECSSLSVEFMRTACLDAANRFLEETPPLNSETPPAPIPTETVNIEARRAALAKERAEIEQARAALEKQRSEQSENERRGVLARLGLARNANDDSNENLSASVTIERITFNKEKIHRFYTTDGDILLEDANNRRMVLPSSLPATAIVKSGFLGSKWLSFAEHPKRSYKIKVITPTK